MKEPLVSVVILNWNGEKWLKKCLPTLQKIKYNNIEIIVVNNGSVDGSTKFLTGNFPKVRLIELKKNVGYAKGNNIGVSNAKGKYVLSLNNDTTVDADFLEPLVRDLEDDSSIAIVQPQIRSMKEKGLLDSVGSYLTSTGFLYHYGYMKSYKNNLYTEKKYFYSIKGTCFLMRRDEYEMLGGFDEDFEYYVEETDLCHRAWLHGKKVLYDPTSVVYHYGGGDMHLMTSSRSVLFRSYRNRLMSYIKNLSFFELLKILPIHIVCCEVYIVASLLKGDLIRASGAQSGVFSIISDLPKILRKREKIQREVRKVKDKEFFSTVKKEPRISYYFFLFYNIKRFTD